MVMWLCLLRGGESDDGSDYMDDDSVLTNDGEDGGNIIFVICLFVFYGFTFFKLI